MAADNILRTFGDVARKEDVVLNAVEILTAKEDQIANMIGRSRAIDTVHTYLTDTLATAASIAGGEEAAFSASARSTPSRLTNLVQNMYVDYQVTRTQRLVEHYHGQDELQRQTKKALTEWGNGLEFDLVRSTLVSGVSGTTPKMKGIIAAISKSTNYTSHTSGTVFSASILDGLMKANWDNSNGDVATDLFVGSFLRNVIDGFTQKTNQLVTDATATRILRTVTLYETSFGVLSIHKHRYVQQSSDATGRILAINPDKLALAWLEMPYIDTGLARTADADPRRVIGKGTLEVQNQDSNWYADGFDKD
jgi:hypothetical protein